MRRLLTRQPTGSVATHAAALVLALCAAHPAIASPIRLSHQGRLLDETGAPLEGEHALVLTLTSPDGAPLWTDTFETELRSGYYHLILGSQRPLDGELFRDLAPGLSIGLEGEVPIPIAETLTHVPYAAVAEWAREAHSVHGGVVDASVVRVNGQTVLQGGATTTLGRVRADQGLQLGAAATAACEAGTRGLLRYPPGGPLQVCAQSGWVEVGGGGAGTCSIVGECPGGEEPSRVWFDELSLVSPEAVDHLCSRFDRVLGKISIHGRFADTEFANVAEIPCVDGVVADIDSTASAGTIMPLVDAVSYDLQAVGRVAFAELERVGRNVSVQALTSESTFPSLHTVGGGLGWSWAEGTDPSLTLSDFLPALETVGESFGSSATGPRIPAPNLKTVGGRYSVPTVSAPNLRTIGGTLTLRGPQPTFPALEAVGGLEIHTAYNPYRRIDPPFALDSLSSLRRIEGDLTISCVRGWELPELTAFVDRIGRENIGGTITLRPSSNASCTDF